MSNIDPLSICQSLSGQQKLEEERPPPQKRVKLNSVEPVLFISTTPSKTDNAKHQRPLAGKRKFSSEEKQTPPKRPNLNPFSPILPQAFMTPSSYKTDGASFPSSPKNWTSPPVVDKPPSPVRTPPEKQSPLLIAGQLAIQQPLRQLGTNNNLIGKEEAQWPNAMHLVAKFP